MNFNEQVAVVCAYINHRKEVNVQINMQQFRNPMNIILLNKAYNIAVSWFNNNGGSINFL